MKRTFLYCIAAVYFIEGLAIFLLETTQGSPQILVDQGKVFDLVISSRGLALFVSVMAIALLPVALLVTVDRLKRGYVHFLFATAGFISAAFLQVAVVLWVYRFAYGFTLDFTWLWYNRGDAVTTLVRVYPLGTIAGLVALIFLLLPWFITVKRGEGKLSGWLIGVLVVLLAGCAAVPIFSANRLDIEEFIYRGWVADRPLVAIYQNEYNAHLQKRISAGLPRASFQESKLGDQIFVLHLESVNAFAANQRTTPTMFEIAQHGIFFPQFYAGSMQTLRAEEVMLCGLPPSLSLTLIEYRTSEELQKVPCLPRYFAEAGYKTLFFKDDDLSFSKTGEFMINIGFQEVHHADIMRPDDQKLAWGYREDIFLQRVAEYLERYRGQKMFVYVALSATNHYPFIQSQDAAQGKKLPHSSATTFVEQYDNSLFIQDAYVKIFWDWYQKHYAQNATFILTPDHPWPVPRHDNINIERNAYDENFLIPFVWVPPVNQEAVYQVGKTKTSRWSQLDLMPTILELGGESCAMCLGESFASTLTKVTERKPQRTKLSMQPYHGGHIAFVDYPKKIILDLTNNTAQRFDLEKDSEERRPEFFSDASWFQGLIEGYFGLTK